MDTTHLIMTGVEQLDLELTETQIVSKKRVADRGEVYTGKREVNAMLDLVKRETERIDSRFLEPACGKGIFLEEILNRKLRVVLTRYKRSQLEYERYAVLAVSSIYGIDILEDNVVECRKRLFDIFDQQYSSLYEKTAKEDCRKSVRYILELNITWGDALTLRKAEEIQPIVFSEWSFAKRSMIKRRDFAFHELLPGEDGGELSLFSDPKLPHFSDLGAPVFLPSPIKDYPLIHFLRIADAGHS